jgi:capsule polysaccharide modification protein KpsS
MLFGDCRPYHQAAIKRAKTLGIEVVVFEEGYLRPNHVTMEMGGVNGSSSIPRDPEFYRGISTTTLPKPHPVGNVMPQATFVTIVNSLACTLFGFRFPKYKHHRDVNTLRQCWFWGRGLFRKFRYKYRDRHVARQLTEQRLPPFFLVALQVHLDSQMNYCKYKSIEEFIVDVVTSFANSAPKDCILLVKHHPFDRPYRDYTKLIDELRRNFALGNRLIYVDVIPLPLALKNARGTVVINSTVGLSSVQYGTPTKCLGAAVYDMAGLTHQGSLEEFWQAPESVDRDLYLRYRHYLRTTNQLNGSVWTDIYEDA